MKHNKGTETHTPIIHQIRYKRNDIERDAMTADQRGTDRINRGDGMAEDRPLIYAGYGRKFLLTMRQKERNKTLTMRGTFYS